MKCLYWNARGLANSPTKLALKRIITVNKPDLVFISEPWMDVRKFPFRWLHRLGLKLFVTQDNSFGISAVYASTNIVARRSLWLGLSHIQSQWNLPWAYIGDFNCILGAHEHFGSRTPARPPIEDFNNWTNINSLVHLPTSGAFYTWKNGRSGSLHIERRLDRTICNQDWFDLWATNSCRTLARNNSDHYPILFEFLPKEYKIASSFKFLQTWASHVSCEDLIAESWKTRVVGCPMFILQRKLQILKVKLKEWNKTTFGNVHDNVKLAEERLLNIQEKIVKEGHSDNLDATEKEAQLHLNIALQREEIFWKEKARVKWQAEGDRNTRFFHRLAMIKQATKRISCLRVNGNMVTEREQMAEHVVSYYTNIFNSSSVLQDDGIINEVIPQLMTEANNTELTRLPSMEEVLEIIKEDVFGAVLQFFKDDWMLPNFNTNTLVLIPKVPNADSIDQFRLIALANFKYKIITKIIADRLSLFMPVLISMEQRAFIKGRSIKDCISVTSEAINLLPTRSKHGNLAIRVDISKAFDTLNWDFLIKVGFFNCKNGVRQGDPLSPLLFCLAEEVLSRGISSLVDNRKVKPIKASRNAFVPSHALYADDIMIFCKGDDRSIIALSNLFRRYAEASDQKVNFSKSTIYAGSISNRRLSYIAASLGFNTGQVPFYYLGAPIFRGRPKPLHFQSIADRICIKLSAWKASLLSVVGRIVLVKSVIQSMMIHTLLVYSWPVFVLKCIQRWARNFIWSGDIDKRKCVTVAWDICCRPYAQGGLGMRSLVTLNEAANLKQCWDLFNSKEQWAVLIRAKVLRNNRRISYHIYSSLWSSMKASFDDVIGNSCWLIGNGERVNFWTDKWFGSAELDSCPPAASSFSHRKDKAVAYILHRKWRLPLDVQVLFPGLANILSLIHLSVEEKEDILVWTPAIDGILTLKIAYEFLYHKHNDLEWGKIIWKVHSPASYSLLFWRLLHNKIPTDISLASRGLYLPSQCSLCGTQEESTNHLFFFCPFATKFWNFLSIALSHSFSSIEDVWIAYNKLSSAQGKVVLLAAVICIISKIWKARNVRRFEDKNLTWSSLLNEIKIEVAFSGNNTPKIKCNTDGAASGIPLRAACGGIFRDHVGNHKGSFSKFIDDGNSLVAELYGAILAVEIAKQRNWSNIRLESDSMFVVLAFSKPCIVPWELRNRWENVLHHTKSINFLGDPHGIC
ncbi:uncharacterized protein LOC131634556 [Vicia villosa]|uniref:uncharacterized protein LOC131634556 n=1 Tax=Vicia villosa TaxID=3911 RepID=UPI00273AFB7C|nr:uncharacterized protein LOC131634556 [Vicia villosa]